MRVWDYIKTLTILLLALFVWSANAQDLLDDESEAASEDLMLDAALEGDLLDEELILDEEPGLDLELPEEELVLDEPELEEELVLEEPPMLEEELVLEEPPVLEEELVLEEPPVLEEELVLEEPPVLEEELVLEEPPVLEEELVLEEPPVLEEELVLEEPPVLEEELVLEEPPVLEEELVLEEPPVLEEELVLEEPPVIEEPPVHVEDPVIEELPIVEERPDMGDAGVDPDAIAAEIKAAMSEGVPEAPSLEGIQIEGLDELLFTENLAILTRKAGEAHALNRLAEGNRLLADGDYDQAVHRYKYAFDHLGRRGTTAESKALAKEGIGKSYYNKSIMKYKLNDKEEALEAARLARNFGHPKAMKLIDMINAGPMDIEDAGRDTFERSSVVRSPDVKKHVKEVSNLLWLGRQRFQARQYDEALEAFEAVLKIQRDNTEAIRMRRKIGLLKYDRATLELEATREMTSAMTRETWNPRHYRKLNAADIKINIGEGSQSADKDLKREEILLKMKNILIPEVDFHQANIQDVVKFLADMSEEYDTATLDEGGMRGVNLILNLGTAGDAGGGGGDGMMDEDDPFAAADDGGFGDEGDSGGASGGIPLVTFTARELTLLEALKIVTEYCGLKFHIKGSVVMIVPMDYTAEEIIPRWYSVMNFTDVISASAADMATGDAGGGGLGLGGGGLDGGDVGGGAAGSDWKAFFESLGVPWPQGTTIKYLPGIGKLMVANTAENLAIFEQILNQFDFVPKQIEIEARFVEINQRDLDSLGLELRLTDDWEIAKKKGSAHLPLSATPQITMAANAANGGFTAGNRFLSSGIGSAGLPVNDTIMRVASVLTNPEMDFILHMMNQKGNTDLLSAPKVTAQSGAEATIKVVEEYIYPTEFTVSGVSGGTGAGGQTGGMSGAVVEPGGFETREVGVLLSVMPEVSAEGQMIMLTLSPEVCEFIRWEDYGSTFSDANGNLQQLRMPQPIFHTRNVSTQIMIFNGATVVMGGMITEHRTSVDDKIPFLGDLPLIGRLFTSRYDESDKRNLLVFVTARLVTPDGRAVKTAEQMNEEQQTSMNPTAVK